MPVVDIFDINATTVAWAIGAVVPLLVAFITKRFASSRVKAVTNLVASAIAGSVIYLVATDGGYDWHGFVNSFVNVLLPSILTYQVWKPLGVAGQDGSIAVASENLGFGDDTGV